MKALQTGYAGMETRIGLQDGNLITGTVQDCTAIHEDAKGRQNAGFTGSSEMKHAARLPLQAIEAYCNRLGITFEEWSVDKAHIRAMLNDPDLSGFRIWTGKVS